MELVTKVKENVITKSIRVVKTKVDFDSCHACGDMIEDDDLYIVNLITQYGNGNSNGNPTYFCKNCFKVLKELINEME